MGSLPTKIYRYKNYNEIDNLTKETIVTCSGVNNIEELSLEEINSFFNVIFKAWSRAKSQI